MCAMLERTQHFFSFAEKAYRIYQGPLEKWTEQSSPIAACCSNELEHVDLQHRGNPVCQEVRELKQCPAFLDFRIRDPRQASQDQQHLGTYLSPLSRNCQFRVFLLFLQKSLDTSIQIIAKFLRTSDIWEHICCILSSPQFHDEVHSRSYYNLKKTTYLHISTYPLDRRK